MKENDRPSAPAKILTPGSVADPDSDLSSDPVTGLVTDSTADLSSTPSPGFIPDQSSVPPSYSQLRAVVHCRLLALADEPYRTFQSRLVPGNDTILGVRVPKIRALAKDICKNNLALSEGSDALRFRWSEVLAAYSVSLVPQTAICYEETMLLGFITASAKMPFDERLRRTAEFVPRIDNWAVCDTFCGTFKPAEKDLPMLWDFLLPYLALGSSGLPAADPLNEFPIRFAVVMLLSYYINETYIDRVLAQLNVIHHEGYYIKMAVAWAVSICFIKYPETTMAYLQNNDLDTFTHNKSIQKIIESYQVSTPIKDILRTMKRK